MEGLKSLSLNELIKRLHDSVKGFVSGMENVISVNKDSMGSDISELREHIIGRLKNGEEITDNRKIISLLDLLSRDQAVLEIVKEDATEWLEVIETIEEHMGSKSPLSPAEAKEVKKIRAMALQLKSLIREE